MTDAQRPPGNRSAVQRWAWLLGAVGAALLVQSAAVSSEFILDDFMHLYQLATLPYWRFLLETYAGHVLITFHLAWSALHALFDLDAPAYYLVALSTHALNTLLLGVILWRHTSLRWAALVAGLWGICPVHQGVLAWLSVYGHVLATTCLLGALAVLERYFAQRRPPPTPALRASVALLLLGAASFGVGIATAFVFPAAAWLLAPQESSPRRVALHLAPVLLVPVAYALARPWIDPSPEGGSILAAITRFPRFLAYGVGLLPAGPYVTITENRLTPGAGWPGSPVTTDQLLAFGRPLFVAVVLLMLWTSVRAERAERRTLAATALLVAASYGILSLGRSPILIQTEETLVMMPRYHYLPLAAVALLFGAASRVWDRSISRARWRLFLGTAIGTGALVLCLGSFRVARGMKSYFSDMQAPRLAQAGFISALERARDGDVQVLENTSFGPVQWVFRIEGKSERFPGVAAWFATVHGCGPDEQTPVRFLERDEELVRRVRAGKHRCIGRILVTESEARAAGFRLPPSPGAPGTRRHGRGSDPIPQASGRPRALRHQGA